MLWNLVYGRSAAEKDWSVSYYAWSSMYYDIRSDFLCNFTHTETYCVSVEKYHVNKYVHIHA